MAQNPIAVAAAVRTNARRLMPNLRRIRSASLLASCMIAICSALGTGGKYSSFEHGMTSTGIASDMSSHEWTYGLDVRLGPLRFQSIIRSPRRLLEFRDGHGRST